MPGKPRLMLLRKSAFFNLSTYWRLGSAEIWTYSFSLLACRLFPLWGEIRRGTLLSAATAECRGYMEVRSCFIVRMHRSDWAPTLAALSTARLKDLFSRFLLSTSPPLAVISQAVRTCRLIPSHFLTFYDSTRTRR